MEIHGVMSMPPIMEASFLEQERETARLVKSFVIERTPTDSKFYEFDNGMTLICYVYYRDLMLNIGDEISWTKEREGIRVYFGDKSLYFKQTVPNAYKVEWNQ